MLTAVILMGGLGLVVGVGLAVASKVFYVYVDPKILAIDDALPGANCGGCGMPGCTANAEAIVAGQSAPNSCVAAGPEVADIIAGILGVSVEAKEPDIALPGCTYGVADADTKFVYDGLTDCRAAALLHGGMKVCNIGCLGLGTCAAVCPFDAITMGPKGLPVVDEQRCTGCGTCERACPKHIITLSSVTRRILKEYTTEDCTTPCQRACPAGINISEYIGQIARGDYHRAVQVIKERNPFPTVIGRICPRPCENECRRHYVDDAVAINYLKRFAADYERRTNEHILPYRAPATKRNVAVVGGGVQGLSAAFFASRLGHTTTVYEAGEQPGGLLRTAIASYRLPAEVLDWDIEGIAAMGVTTETGKVLGRDITIDGLLREGNDAIFLAMGGWDSRLARTQGKPDPTVVPGCHLMIDVMKASPDHPVALDGHVVILGNLNLSEAMLKRCQELGAGSITVVVNTASAPKAGLPDVNVMAHSGVRRLIGRDDAMTGLELIDLASGQVQTLDCDHLVLASGRIPELIFAKTPAGGDEDTAHEGPLNWHAFAPYKQPAYHQQTGLMAEGDVLTDFSAAIKAIGAGRRAAASIHRTIYGIDLELPDHVVTPETPVQNVDHVDHVPTRLRQIMPLATDTELARQAELEKGYSEDAARKEADRCLQCGLICYRHQEPSESVVETAQSASGA